MRTAHGTSMMELWRRKAESSWFGNSLNFRLPSKHLTV